MTCPKCGKETAVLYLTAGGESCFMCVPDSDLETYPGWKLRELKRQRAAEIARVNFKHITAE